MARRISFFERLRRFPTAALSLLLGSLLVLLAGCSGYGGESRRLLDIRFRPAPAHGFSVRSAEILLLPGRKAPGSWLIARFRVTATVRQTTDIRLCVPGGKWTVSASFFPGMERDLDIAFPSGVISREAPISLRAGSQLLGEFYRPAVKSHEAKTFWIRYPG